ncbi:ATP-dependent DNA helicase [Coralliovum pocilloporae]|uniref:ATP-dependent DNA helicase n=1 Tax=Coralliovum pocilloporae TaxID=3066369 RepID=UPI003306B879
MTALTWSTEQDRALKETADWLKGRSGGIFRLFGYAGTGKTTIARHLAEGVNGNVLFAAYTGKAADVLRQKGCPDASTIHSLIYRLDGEDDEEGTPEFRLNKQSKVKDASLVIIDECSMVDEQLGTDLLSFGTPVLVLGDPAQLPPVAGGGYFTDHEPDVMLTEIHRQSADNPIIQLAETIRNGGRLSPGTYGDSRVIRKQDITSEDVLEADQILVGLNRTRRRYNQRIRELKGFLTDGPQRDDRLVCLRNDHQKGFLNGSIWHVIKMMARRGDRYRMHIASDDQSEGVRRLRISVHEAFFEGRENEMPWQLRRNSDEFDFGYALTVHKAQGSQWDNVILFDESGAFREHRDRWLYTGITRAAQSLTVVLP